MSAANIQTDVTTGMKIGTATTQKLGFFNATPIVQGTAFNWPWPDHFRVVTLPRVDDLEMAIGRIGNFLYSHISVK